MGACTDARSFEAPNEKAALAKARAIMAEAREAQGNDTYAGHIGICEGVKLHRAAKPITREQAGELLFGKFSKDGLQLISAGLTEKWGPAILVRIKNVEGSRKRRWFLGGMCAS